MQDREQVMLGYWHATQDYGLPSDLRGEIMCRLIQLDYYPDSCQRDDDCLDSDDNWEAYSLHRKVIETYRLIQLDYYPDSCQRDDDCLDSDDNREAYSVYRRIVDNFVRRSEK